MTANLKGHDGDFNIMVQEQKDYEAGLEEHKQSNKTGDYVHHYTPRVIPIEPHQLHKSQYHDDCFICNDKFFIQRKNQNDRWKNKQLPKYVVRDENDTLLELKDRRDSFSLMELPCNHCIHKICWQNYIARTLVPEWRRREGSTSEQLKLCNSHELTDELILSKKPFGCPACTRFERELVDYNGRKLIRYTLSEKGSYYLFPSQIREASNTIDTLRELAHKATSKT